MHVRGGLGAGVSAIGFADLAPVPKDNPAIYPGRCPPSVGLTIGEELQAANARFLGFILLAAAGFIGEVQLAIADHSSGDPVGRVILGASALCAAFIAGWGGFAAAEAFVDMAYARGEARRRAMASAPGASLADPAYPWAARQGRRMRRGMEVGITGGERGGHTLNFLVIAYAALLVVIVGWGIW